MYMVKGNVGKMKEIFEPGKLAARTKNWNFEVLYIWLEPKKKNLGNVEDCQVDEAVHNNRNLLRNRQRFGQLFQVFLGITRCKYRWLFYNVNCFDTDKWKCSIKGLCDCTMIISKYIWHKKF